MNIPILLIVLSAALFNSCWNAIVKISGDRIVIMAIITIYGSLFSLLLIPFVELPAPEDWTWLSFAITLHTLYHFSLTLMYKYGDFGQSYPIARGVAPLLVTCGAFFFANEIISTRTIIGIVLITSGIIFLAWKKGSDNHKLIRSFFASMCTGILIASYTLVDGIGARHSTSALGFAVFLTLGNGVITFAIAYSIKFKEVNQIISNNLKLPFLGGTMQVSAYWIVIYAMSVSPIGSVSAIRETSVLLGALISVFLLKEGLGILRILSAVLITIGIFQIVSNT